MTTRVLLIRHAKPLSEGFAEDSMRPLAEEGKRVQFHAALELQRLGISPSKVYTSPLLRAVETAEIIVEVLGGTLIEEKALGELFDAEALLIHLPDPALNKTIIFVGHAPTLLLFAKKLVGKQILEEGLSKSASLIIDFHEACAFGKGTFTRHLPPPQVAW